VITSKKLRKGNREKKKGDICSDEKQRSRIKAFPCAVCYPASKIIIIIIITMAICFDFL